MASSGCECFPDGAMAPTGAGRAKPVLSAVGWTPASPGTDSSQRTCRIRRRSATKVTPARPRIGATRRLEAVGAVVGAVAAAVLLIAVLLGNTANLALGLLGLSLAVAGGWTVATERRARRVVGAIVLTIGLGVVAIAARRTFVRAGGIDVRMVVVLALVVLTFVCMRS